MEKVFTIKDREKLYNEIWQEPVIIVAKKYGISDTALRKRCKKLDIPIPPRGYWEKVRSGQKIKKPLLPKIFGGYVTRDSVIKYKYSSEELTDEELLKLGELGLLTDETKSLIMDKCNNIKVKTQLRKPHELIIKHQEEMKLRKQEEKKLKESSFPFNFYSNREVKYTNFSSNLPIHVSDKNIKRAYRIMDALFSAIEELDGSINIEPFYGEDVANFRIGHNHFNFELKEEENKKQLQNSNNKVVDKLVLVIFNDSSYGKDLTKDTQYKDTKDNSLESKLGKVIYDMFVIDNKMSILEEIGQRESDRRWEEEKRQKHLKETREQELERVSVLEKIVSDWDKAQKMRSFSDSLENGIVKIDDNSDKGEMMQWIKWIRDKADWLDPLVVKEDKILGKRTDIQKILGDMNAMGK